MAIDPKQVQAAFLEAIAAKPEERAAILERLGAGDAELRRRVEMLVRAHDDSGELPAGGEVVDTLSYEPKAAPPAALQPGCLFAGRYKLREKLGEGGMGIVWVADQTAPVQRRIALKVIKSTDDSRRLLARFEQERQALALMDHPHIAKVFDAGVSDDGRPYFAMEFIKGVPLTKYCDDAKLTPKERLELFVPVCQAVQHAHQKGIIHRDLKPSKILVGLYDGRPVPKVIDFGVAKATGPQLSEQSIYTEVGTMIGTVEYMSPEQAELNNLDIDTRSDIYALGVILYELLTGGVPFSRQEMKAAGFAEMLRIIKEVEPPKPSTRLSGSGTLPSVAACRHTEPNKLTRLVRGELDWIVMKCLEKDRSRRYETANGFAKDIERFLNHEPVQAGPPTAAYRIKKFVRRNRGPVIAVSLVLLALVFGIIGTALGLRRALVAESRTQDALADVTTQKDLAEKSATESKLVLGFFKDKVLAAARPKGEEGGLGKDATIREALEAAEPEIAKAFADQPAAEASIRNALGDTYFYLDESSQAIRQYEKAVELRRTALGPDHRDTLRSIYDLGTAFQLARRFDEALPFLEKSFERRTATLGPDHLDTLESKESIANSLQRMGRLTDAIFIEEETLTLCRSKFGADYSLTLISMNNLANMYAQAERLADALPLFAEVVRLNKAKYGPDYPTTLVGVSNLANAYTNMGRWADSIPLLEEALPRANKILGIDHQHTLLCMTTLANAYSKAGRPAEALRLREEVARRTKMKYGPENPDTLTSMNNLADAYRAAGKLDLALPLSEETLKLRKVKLGTEHIDTLTSMNDLARAYRDAGKLDLAVPLMEETLKLQKIKLGPDDPRTLVGMNDLAMAYKAVGNLNLALPLLEETLELKKAKYGPEHNETLAGMNNLGMVYHAARKLDLALPLLEETLRLVKVKLGPKNPNTLTCMNNLAEAYMTAGKRDQARSLYKEMLAISRISSPKDNIQLVGQLVKAGNSLLQAEAFTEAEPLIRECLAIDEKAEPDARRTFNTKSMLGWALLGQKKYAEAEPMLVAGYEEMKQREKTIPPQSKIRLTEALDRLVQLYEAMGKKDDVAKWRLERAKYPVAAPKPQEKK